MLVLAPRSFRRSISRAGLPHLRKNGSLLAGRLASLFGRSPHLFCEGPCFFRGSPQVLAGSPCVFGSLPHFLADSPPLFGLAPQLLLLLPYLLGRCPELFGRLADLLGNLALIFGRYLGAGRFRVLLRRSGPVLLGGLAAGLGPLAAPLRFLPLFLGGLAVQVGE
ncbi:MAG: hypothetical protein JO252_14760 [Planctomycetaceae bacterium]|nr:hypothetical protein [Planctomycetaceae bacterium]MBV8556861.1 hypothetical protein [Planctomycetaceae bacterium]MBV8606421.1 hypothetical protein [Singulisphaera sp.]